MTDNIEKEKFNARDELVRITTGRSGNSSAFSEKETEKENEKEENIQKLKREVLIKIFGVIIYDYKNNDDDFDLEELLTSIYEIIQYDISYLELEKSEEVEKNDSI